MPDDQRLSCLFCTYSRAHNESGNRICDIWGIECDHITLCRSFRIPQVSHTEARKRWKLLNDLKPGIVYCYDKEGDPAIDFALPRYKVVAIAKV